MEKQTKYYLKDTTKEKESAQVKGLLIINVARYNGSVYSVRSRERKHKYQPKNFI